VNYPDYNSLNFGRFIGKFVLVCLLIVVGFSRYSLASTSDPSNSPRASGAETKQIGCFLVVSVFHRDIS
jgi:hypothetical protein